MKSKRCNQNHDFQRFFRMTDMNSIFKLEYMFSVEKRLRQFFSDFKFEPNPVKSELLIPTKPYNLFNSQVI